MMIHMPDTLFQEAKARAFKSGMKFEDLVAQYIEDGLREKVAEAPILLREHVQLPVFRKKGGALIATRSNAALFEVLELEETA